MKKLSIELLDSLSLTSAQASVYLAVLELGESNMQDVARKSGVKRTSIYHFIDDLKQRGLINETMKRTRKIYSAVDPRQLLEIQKNRLKELEMVMPELLAVQNYFGKKPRVAYYDGTEGMKEVYMDMLQDKKEILAFEDIEHMMATLKTFFTSYPVERAKRQIPFRSIIRDSNEARAVTKMNIKLLRKSKLIKSADWKTEINIYGDKVAMMSLRSKQPFAVLIEDADIAETLRVAWKELWERLDEPIIG